MEVSSTSSKTGVAYEHGTHHPVAPAHDRGHERSSLVRILLDSNLWPHFANTTALQAFWALEDHERRKLWGDIIDPNDALADFDPRDISDGQLGAP